MSYKLYSYPNNPRVWKAVIAGKYVGVTIETPAFQIGVDNKTKEFAEKNPLQKVPVLETPEGCLFESNAIARYVARQGTSLYGANAFEASQIDQWIDFSANEIELPSAAWLFPILEIVPFNKDATARAKSDVRKSLEVLNKHLTFRTFLVGERLSLADIVVSMALYRLYKMVLDAGFRKPFTNLNRWYLTCVNQPEFKSVIGEVVLCEKMMVAKLPPKEDKPKEQPKQQEKPKPKPTTEGADEDEPAAAKAPKAKSALELLPPSKFDLDEWKRTYSNLDIRKEALPWFWEHYDPEGWSIWFSHYKYNDELKKLFMTNNLVGGFLQRLDKLRKWGFGSLLIFGEEPSLEVSGCWLVRGTVLPEELYDNPDVEHYTWTKADPKDEATKKLIEAYWAWDGDFGGKVFHEEGKIFK
jgi:elongation factor 1-gamma